MEITQEKPKYNPITITLETKDEAEGLLALADMFDQQINAHRAKLASEIARKISDAFTNGEVSV